jgi:pilus assembly protein CpaC
MNGRSWSPRGRVGGRVRWVWCLAVLGMLGLTMAEQAGAQALTAQEVVRVARGQSALLPQPAPVQRISIADPAIADAVVISPLEVLVNGIALGTTTLIIWDQQGRRRVYQVEVSVDAGALQRTIQTLFPGEQVRITAAAGTLIVTGQVTDTRIARQILALAQATGAEVIDNLTAPPAQQVLLQVRIAEMSRSAARDFSSQLRVLNPQDLTGDGDWLIETASEGLLRLFLADPGANLEAIFRALRTTSEVRMLAEPNLIAMDGSPASFLAGGEFPFPVAQAGPAGVGQVTIEWREFGVRLNFTPVLTGAGNIRVVVEPEVSSLDFATGLVVGGFAVPSLLTRRARTEVELQNGQTFAIAGLLDNTTLNSVTRIPILGDLPIIGPLFRTRLQRDDRTELLVLVTPRLIGPMTVPPPVPPGEPETWPRDRSLRDPVPHPMPVPQPRPAQPQS